MCDNIKIYMYTCFGENADSEKQSGFGCDSTLLYYIRKKGGKKSISLTAAQKVLIRADGIP